MKELLCKAFCDAITVTEIPSGFAIRTGFKRGADHLGLFAIRKTFHPELMRLEDDGLTVATLADEGVDVFEGHRAQILSQLMQELNIQYDEEEATFHTPFMKMEEAAKAVTPFLSFLLRIQDFKFLTRARIEETFKADVITALRNHFAGRADLSLSEPATHDLMNYVADVVIRPPHLPPLAIYIGSSETKALEALVFAQEVEIKHLTCNVMLVVRTARPTGIKGRTLARASTRLPVIIFPNNIPVALQEIDQAVFGVDPLSSEAEREHVRIRH